MDAPMPVGIYEAWNKFVPETTQRDRDICLEIFNDGWLFPLQRKREIVAMMNMTRDIGARVVMEIGADKGGGFYHWLACVASVEKAIAIELRGVPFAKKMTELFPEVQLMCKASSSRDVDTIFEVGQFLGQDKIDVLFIDGEKSMVSADFAEWAPRVREGGLIFIHDIVDDIEPQRFFYSLRDRFKLGVIIDAREGANTHQLPAPLSAWDNWLKVWKTNSCGVGVVFV